MKNNIALLLFLVFAATAFSADNKVVPVGKKVTINVSVTSGQLPFSYQWKKNGTDIAGATEASYVIPVFTAAHAGNYSVQVTNSTGTTRSDDAVVLAPLPPSRGSTSIVVSEPDPVPSPVVP